MGIIAPNEASSLDTVRSQGRVRVLNPTSRTLPKSGKNGTASLFSGNLDRTVAKVPTKEGNTFGNNRYTDRKASVSHEKQFGQRSNVAIATGNGSNASYIATDGHHPNAHFFDVARQPKREPSQPGSPSENHSRPAGVFKRQRNAASSVMPHNRNGIGANQGMNLSKRATFRASAGGASKTLPSDTPFHKLAVKRQPSVTQVTGVPRPPDTSSKRDDGKVSFGTRSNLWYDPNNSFAHGVKSTGTGRAGTGRWNIIKRGAAG